ncbi:hypothetical protein, partial [Ornithinibacillus gellani]|uniref:hypothetical protein n=1 Tax=Ornithinibacillus gellani TaxID=2293253 RepID=UPI001CC1C76C
SNQKQILTNFFKEKQGSVSLDILVVLFSFQRANIPSLQFGDFINITRYRTFVNIFFLNILLNCAAIITQLLSAKATIFNLP